MSRTRPGGQHDGMTGIWPPEPGPQPPPDGFGPVGAKTPTTSGVFSQIRGSGFVRPSGSPGAGVCAAVGHRLGIDPLLVRILLVMAALVGGIGVVTYGVAWLLLPGADGRIHVEQLIRGGQLSAGLLGGVGLILMGTSGSLSWLDGGLSFTLITGAVVLTAVGAWLFRIVRRADPAGIAPPPSVADPAPLGGPPTVNLNKEAPMSLPAPPTPHVAATPPTRSQPPDARPDIDPAGPTTAALDLSAYGVSAAATTPESPTSPRPLHGDGFLADTTKSDSVSVAPWPSGGSPQPVAQPVARRVRRPVVSGRTVGAVGGLALIVAAGVLVADRALPWAPITGTAASAAALAVIAVATIAAGLRGRRGGGLIGLGIVALLLSVTGPTGSTARSVLTDENGQWATDFGDRAWTLSGSVTEDHDYRVRMGQATLDLSEVTPLAPGAQAATVTLGCEAGELIVRVPDDLTVSYDLGAETGSVVVTTVGGTPVEAAQQQGMIGPSTSPDLRIVGTAQLGVISIEQVAR